MFGTKPGGHKSEDSCRREKLWSISDKGRIVTDTLRCLSGSLSVPLFGSSVSGYPKSLVDGGPDKVLGLTGKSSKGGRDQPHLPTRDPRWDLRPLKSTVLIPPSSWTSLESPTGPDFVPVSPTPPSLLNTFTRDSFKTTKEILPTRVPGLRRYDPNSY